MRRERGRSISQCDKCSCDNITRGSESIDAARGECGVGTLEESPVLFQHNENHGCE